MIIRVSLPYIVKDYINDKLGRLQNYTGQMQDISLSILAGKMTLDELSLKTKNPVFVNTAFNTPSLLVSLSYASLFRGKLKLAIVLNQPKLAFTTLKKSPSKTTQVTDVWQELHQLNLPAAIDSISVHEGMLTYSDKTVNPLMMLSLCQLEMHLTGLQQGTTSGNSLPASFNATGITTGNGAIMLKLSLNPRAHLPTFNLDASLEHVNLKDINSLLAPYTDLRAAQGQFSFYMEAAAKNGMVKGYVKPFFENVKVDLPQAKKGNPFKQIYKGIVNWLSGVLTNNKTEKAATRIEFSGNINDSDASIWAIIWKCMENGFFRALLPGIDSSILF